MAKDNPYWHSLDKALYEHVPGRAADEIRRIVGLLVEHETAEANRIAAEATGLMMKGEALRERMKLEAILGGAYNHIVPKPEEA